jgi:hypothetical protein
VCDTCGWEPFIDFAEEVIELCDAVGSKHEGKKGEEFALSVQERVSDILNTVTDNEHVTDRQETSLENMKAGLERWRP